MRKTLFLQILNNYLHTLLIFITLYKCDLSIILLKHEYLVTNNWLDMINYIYHLYFQTHVYFETTLKDKNIIDYFLKK